MIYFHHRIRDITKEVAAAVVKEAIEEDLAEGYREMDSRELRKLDEVFLLYGSFYVPVTLEIKGVSLAVFA